MTDTLTPILRSGIVSAPPRLSHPPVWDDEVDPVLVCTGVVTVTHDVKTFVLESSEPRAFRHQPGQYLTLTLPIEGGEMSRCYTISSPPTRPRAVTITVKRQPGGQFSNWLHDHLSTGDHVAVSGPLGSFSMAEHPAPKYLFLSAGSGITPMLSMTRTLCDLGEPTDVAFVHSARTPDDIICRQELAFIDETAAGIRMIPVCEADSTTERWTGLRGRLSPPMLLGVVPDLLEREVFTCGPPAYMAAVREILTGAGVDPSRTHEESFDFEDLLDRTQPPTGAVPDENVGRVFSVRFSRSNRSIECGADVNVLDAALRAGIPLPSSCGQGMCGTCKCTLLDGSVDMRHAGGIRPREIAGDKILICCSKPLADLVVDA